MYKWNPLSKFKRAGSSEVRETQESLIIPWKVSGSGRLELFKDRKALGLKRTCKHHFYRLLISTQAKPCLQPIRFQSVIQTNSPFSRGCPKMVVLGVPSPGKVHHQCHLRAGDGPGVTLGQVGSPWKGTENGITQ